MNGAPFVGEFKFDDIHALDAFAECHGWSDAYDMCRSFRAQPNDVIGKWFSVEWFSVFPDTRGQLHLVEAPRDVMQADLKYVDNRWVES